MDTFLREADSVLRGDLEVIGQDRRKILHFVGCIAFFGFIYGSVMGAFAGVAEGRILQVLYSAIKVPLLLTVTFFLTLPSYFILNSIMGLRADFTQALWALAAAQAGLTIILTSFAPLTLLWYASSANYEAAILFNALMFGLASFAAQWLLARLYRPLILRNPHHRPLLYLWLCLYAFVGIQMGWVLRPFIGAPNMPTQFFREDAWSNAYVVVLRLIWAMVTG